MSSEPVHDEQNSYRKIANKWQTIKKRLQARMTRIGKLQAHNKLYNEEKMWNGELITE